ncbi:MAG: histidine triad nucleotide-binding protein [Candidatus Theseobacter exili]|nr:histidine triad nucleotide-binding protein [Candidatus Theseobacter exili]
MSDCLFCKIAKKEIPSEVVYEDESFFAFKDINPQAPVHVLVIPKEHFATVNDLEDTNLAGGLVIKAKEIAKKLGVDQKGYRFVLNCLADAGQEVFHVHGHLLAGRKFTWPPG